MFEIIQNNECFIGNISLDLSLVFPSTVDGKYHALAPGMRTNPKALYGKTLSTAAGFPPRYHYLD